MKDSGVEEEEEEEGEEEEEVAEDKRRGGDTEEEKEPDEDEAGGGEEEEEEETEGEAGGEGEEEFSWGKEEEGEDGGKPAAPRTASGISVGINGAEKGGIGVSSSLKEEEEVDGVMRWRVVVPSAKEEAEGAGSTRGDVIIVGSLTACRVVVEASTGEEAIRMRGAVVSVVMVVVVVVEACVGKRYGRPPMYKAPNARRSK